MQLGVLKIFLVSAKIGCPLNYALYGTPCGAVSYLSKCWGGRATDKCITMHSDFIRLMEYGDVVRGFDIAYICIIIHNSQYTTSYVKNPVCNFRNKTIIPGVCVLKQHSLSATTQSHTVGCHRPPSFRVLRHDTSSG